MTKNFSLSIAIKLQIKKINSQQTICEICVMFDKISYRPSLSIDFYPHTV